MQKPRTALVPFLVVLAALLLAGAPAAAAGGPPPSVWTPAGPMATLHSEAAVAQLSDGDALVVSGTALSGFITAAERYDAATDSWSPAGDLTTARAKATATTLADGRVLVVGGRAGAGVLASAELFDPATGLWTAADSLAQARSEHTATLLGDGTVLVAGGTDGNGTVFASAERYDPATDTWTPAPAMATERIWHSATQLADGSVVVTGGGAQLMGPMTDSVERFDPATATWTSLPSLPQARAQHATLALPGGALLVVGGFDGGTFSIPRVTVRLDPGAASWSTVGPTTFNVIAAAALPNGLVLLVQSDEAKLLDPASGQLANAGILPGFRLAPALLPLSGGELLVVGGSSLDDALPVRFTPRPQPLIAPAAFGDQTVGRSGTTIPLPLLAGNEMPLFVRRISLEGPDAGDFELVADNCTGIALEERESCFASVRFTPRGEGLRMASLVLSAPGLPGDGRQLVSLSGTGVAVVVPAPPAPAQPAPPAPAPPPPVARPAPRAPAEPRLRCAARKGRRVVCTGLPRSLGSGKVRLSRAGIVHATGTLKNGRLTLTVRRRLFDRRYALVVGKRAPLKVVID